MSRYQGLVALEGKSLEDAAHEYFLPLRADPDPRAARGRRGSHAPGRWRTPRWRAGGLLLQFLPKAPERARQPDLHPGDAPDGTEVHALARGRRLGRRPFAGGNGARMSNCSIPLSPTSACSTGCSMSAACAYSATRELTAECSCTRDSVANMLQSFSQDDRDHMVENGVITVTCEFCSSTYVFEPDAVADMT